MDSGRKGSIYTVFKIGFLALPAADMPIEDLFGISPRAGKYVLPTAELLFSGGRQLCKLPVQLTDWAFDLVAQVQSTGRTPFPSEIEFGVLDGRHYAEML